VALSSTGRCTFPANPANPRAAVVQEFSARLAEFVAAGDLDARAHKVGTPGVDAALAVTIDIVRRGRGALLRHMERWCRAA